MAKQKLTSPRTALRRFLETVPLEHAQNPAHVLDRDCLIHLLRKRIEYAREPLDHREAYYNRMGRGEVLALMWADGYLDPILGRDLADIEKAKPPDLDGASHLREALDFVNRISVYDERIVPEGWNVFALVEWGITRLFMARYAPGNAFYEHLPKALKAHMSDLACALGQPKPTRWSNPKVAPADEIGLKVIGADPPAPECAELAILVDLVDNEQGDPPSCETWLTPAEAVNLYKDRLGQYYDTEPSNKAIKERLRHHSKTGRILYRKNNQGHYQFELESLRRFIQREIEKALNEADEAIFP